MTSLLNSEQELAVQHIEGPLLVLAGAGSGKTRIVTHRIIHLLNLGVPAGEILALTFTNKAADEMKYRIKELSNQSVLICTFHALGARILRESIHELGFSSHFTIYDEDDSIHLVKECLRSLEYADDKSIVKNIKHGISNAKNNLISPDKIDVSNSSEAVLLKQVYVLYQKRLKEYNALDFDDLLFHTVTLIRDNVKIREKYQKRWSFVLIDEYQDTNMAQYVLTRLLVEKHHNLFVVGDPDQSIYSWRGANIHNILNFQSDFENAKIIKLEQNYRSTNHILSGANGLIKHNYNRYEKNLWSGLGDGEKIQIRILENESEEARYVLEKVVSHHRKGVSLDKMVVFYRTNAQSRMLEDVFLKHKLPYIIIGGISFYQRREIKDMLAFLRVSFSPSDFLSFSRTINLPKRGLGPTAIEKLKNYSEKYNKPILDVCNQMVNGVPVEGISLSAKQISGVKEYLSIMRFIQEGSQNKKPLKEIIKQMIELSKYLDYLKEDVETYQDRKDNLDALIAKAAEWEAENETSLTLFVEELSLKSNADEHHKMSESVRLMTLHNGKGLEFDVVCMVGLEEELLPHVNSKDSSEAIEEERRLCYVGMTRAKRHLYMTASKYRLIWGTPRIMEPSRFLNELDPKHIDWGNNKEDEKSDSGEFKVGSRVLHKDFGEGIIKKIYNTSLGATYDVFFPHIHSTKSLVAKFAKLVIA